MDAGLSREKQSSHTSGSSPTTSTRRSPPSTIHVWYATFGSSMWKERFLCYIRGGQVKGMRKPCLGSKDKSPPKEIIWKAFHHRLFFGRFGRESSMWGSGGVAFLHPNRMKDEQTHMRLYRITLQQFNDVLLQENGSGSKTNSPAFDLAALNSVKSRGSMEVLKTGWYRNVIYLGDEGGIPIVTTTCPISDIESGESGKLSLLPPSKEYEGTLVNGLVEGGQLSKEEAEAYIQKAKSSLRYIWYATFGSNMWKQRFLCYIRGGQVNGMRKPCLGSMDKSPPKEIIWKTFPHRLFFGRESSVWGGGGVAFLHPESSVHEKTHMCLYRITLQQFNDVLLQENGSGSKTNSLAFDSAALNSVKSRGSMEVLKTGWYRNVIYLGDEGGIPIVTMTCPPSYIESCKTGKLSRLPPSKKYEGTLVNGLVEGGQLSKVEATAYIEEASNKPLS